MTTSYTLTGSLADLVGSESVPTSATLDTNLGEVALVDLDNNSTRLPGSAEIELDANLAFSLTLIATDSTGTNILDGSLRYIVRVEYRDGAGVRRSWNSGYFELTANTDLSDAVGEDVALPAIAAIQAAAIDAPTAENIDDVGSLTRAALDALYTGGGGGGGSTAWAAITGKPATFPPTVPIAQADITGLTADLAAKADASALATEATTARNADNLTNGTVADARIASTIARDSEVTAAVAAEAALARNGDNITSGTVADARIASTIARDAEVTAAVSAEASARDAAIAVAVAALMDSAPGALDTLNELAAAMGDDPNFAATVTNALALKAPLASPALTGNPTAPTPTAGDNDTSIATTAFVETRALAAVVDSIADADTTHAPSRNAVFDALALKAPLASPTFTGTVAGVTATHVGLGNVDNTSNATERAATATLTNKRITKRVVTTADTATLTIASDDYDAATVTALAQAMTIAAPTGTPTSMQSLVIRIKDNGTARALTWDAAFRAIGVTLPTTTVISKTVYVGAMWNATDSKWDALAVATEA